MLSGSEVTQRPPLGLKSRPQPKRPFAEGCTVEEELDQGRTCLRSRSVGDGAQYTRTKEGSPALRRGHIFQPASVLVLVPLCAFHSKCQALSILHCLLTLFFIAAKAKSLDFALLDCNIFEHAVLNCILLMHYVHCKTCTQQKLLRDKK